MYNRQFKEKYIRAAAIQVYRERQLSSLFSFTEPFEVAAGKDVYNFSETELQTLIQNVTGKGYSEKQKAADIKSYMLFARTVHETFRPMPSDSAFDTDERAARLVYFANEIHLQSVLDQYYEPESYGSFDNIYRLTFWFAFAGIFNEDVYTITSTLADTASLQIKLPDRVYKLPREAEACLRNCMFMTSFFGTRTNNDKIAPKEFKRIDGNVLVRGSKSNSSFDVLAATISRRNRAALSVDPFAHRLTYMDVWRSGVFHRMSVRQMAGIPVDFSDVAIEMVTRRSPDKDTSEIRRPIKNAVNMLNREYEKWKDAFRPTK